MADYRETVLDHYRQVADDKGLSEQSTMEDTTTRRKEVEVITTLLDTLVTKDGADVLEIGCGNGLLLSLLRERYSHLRPSGLDFSEDMVELARSRKIDQCEVHLGDVTSLKLDAESFDYIIGERCLINVMERDGQAKALKELARVLRPGGYYIMIEAFTDGLRELNEAREEVGLEPNEQAYHNLWFDESWFRETIADDFEVVDLASLDTATPLQQHFLSSYYFMSRVVYPCVTQSKMRYNTHFVRFFADLPARGSYSPIQLFLLRRR